MGSAGMFSGGFPVLQGFPTAALLPNLAGLAALPGAWPQGFNAAAAQQGWLARPAGMQQAMQLQEQHLQHLQSFANGQLGMQLVGPMAAAAMAMQQQQQSQQQRQQQQQSQPGLSAADLYAHQVAMQAGFGSQAMAWTPGFMVDTSDRTN